MIPFRKMHGLGNDFVVIDGRETGLRLTTDEVRLIADRRLGVGCDQLIIMEPAQTLNGSRPDIFMRIYNPDGSEAEACGNATRCVASLLMAESGGTLTTIETLRGLLVGEAADGGDVTIDMGAAQLDWQEIPLSDAMDTLHLPIDLGVIADPVGVGMGNPHCVFFVDDAEAIDLAGLGPRVEHHALFPQRTNVEIAEVRADGSIRLRVWERGAGITMACGSGACATAVAAIRRGLTDRKVAIELDGGVLKLEWLENGNVLMTGPVATAYTGELSL